MAGVALGKGPVTAIVGQSGDVVHGIVDLASSNVAGWYGLKTDWAISPHYGGKQLDGNGPAADSRMRPWVRLLSHPDRP